MKKRFNVNGSCNKEKHYMVDLSSRLDEVRRMVDNGDYFVINRARQYGKTTILRALSVCLQDMYRVIFIDFQRMSTEDYADEHTFSTAFGDSVYKFFSVRGKLAEKDIAFGLEQMKNAMQEKSFRLRGLFDSLNALCKASCKRVVLLIDEVDSAVNNQVFLDFLAQLRSYYLEREEVSTFHSVILAGVYDIKNMKLKIRPDVEHRYNSPWNIAADFNVDMNFDSGEIKGMLLEYEKDCQTGMDTDLIAELIYDYTSGYPYLVSRLCQIMDEGVAVTDRNPGAVSWTREGILDAVKALLKESSTLFDDIRKKLDDFPELRKCISGLLFDGSKIPYSRYNYILDVGIMFGFLKEDQGTVVVANRVFEMFFYNLFISEQALESLTYQTGEADKKQFVQDGELNMELVLRKFTEHFTDVYGDNDQKFVEENGRRIFLLYLKPIINGVGNYYVEAQTRDRKRTDVIVDYKGKQYIIELKIWYGEEYNRRGREQLSGYLEYYHMDKGYLVSFCFNKSKMVGVRELLYGGKTIVEAVV